MDTTIHAPNSPEGQNETLAPPMAPARRVQNLSAVGGDWQAPEYVIDRVVLADDGVLYVDEAAPGTQRSSSRQHFTLMSTMCLYQRGL